MKLMPHERRGGEPVWLVRLTDAELEAMSIRRLAQLSGLSRPGIYYRLQKLNWSRRRAASEPRLK